MHPSRFAVAAALGALVLLSCYPGCPTGVEAATAPRNCSTVAEILEYLNDTTLLTILNETGLLPNISDPAFRGTLLAPSDEAFGAALNVISTNAGGIGNALSDQILPLISTILSGHILSTPYPVLRGGNYPTLDPGTSLNINSTTRVVTPRATDGSRGAFGNVLPPVTLEDLEGEEACNAYVYTLEGFVIVSPSIFPQLITASG